MKRAIIQNTLLAFGLLFIQHTVFFLLNQPFHPSLYIIYVYMWLIAFIFDRVLLKESDPKKFTNFFMALSGGKLMLSLFILVIYALFNETQIVPFAITFMVLYFVFTGVEITRLVRHLKKLLERFLSVTHSSTFAPHFQGAF